MHKPVVSASEPVTPPANDRRTSAQPATDDRCAIAEPAAPRPMLRRFLPLAVVVALAVLVYAMGWHRELTLETVVRHRAALDAFIEAHEVAALAAFVALYAAVVAL